MPTLTDHPVTGTASGLRLAAMRALADDCTAEMLREWAADTELLEHMAHREGRPAENIAGEMIAVAAMVDRITRGGVTRDHCRFVLGTDKTPAPSLVLVTSAA